MARSLYVAGSGPESGKSAVILGVLDAMTRRVGRVGLFLPVVHAGPTDPLITLVRMRYPQVLPDEAAIARCCGVTYEAVHADPDGAVAAIVERFAAVDRKNDAVLVVGTDFTDVGAPSELDFNGRVAVNLGAPVLLVVTGHDRTPAAVAATVDMATTALSARACEILGVVANRVPRRDLNAVRAALANRQGVEVLPELPLLSAPQVGQVFRACHATTLYGDPHRREAEVLSFGSCSTCAPGVWRSCPGTGRTCWWAS
jgi:phosphate acetyltransferase